jgi:hypothetical protein
MIYKGNPASTNRRLRLLSGLLRKSFGGYAAAD